jgi:hypothetical protein
MRLKVDEHLMLIAALDHEIAESAESDENLAALRRLRIKLRDNLRVVKDEEPGED